MRPRQLAAFAAALLLLLLLGPARGDEGARSGASRHARDVPRGPDEDENVLGGSRRERSIVAARSGLCRCCASAPASSLDVLRPLQHGPQEPDLVSRG